MSCLEEMEQDQLVAEAPERVVEWEWVEVQPQTPQVGGQVRAAGEWADLAWVWGAVVCARNAARKRCTSEARPATSFSAQAAEP